MSRFTPNFFRAAQVIAAADKFKQRCLLDQEPLMLNVCLGTSEHFR
ncbi:hypothetical protein [Roseateles sp.]